MEKDMEKSLRFCKHPGCSNLTNKGYCDEHKEEGLAKEVEQRKQADRKRGSASQRGYTFRWAKYSKNFLKRPENALCKLHLDDGCAIVSQCVDHIDPPSGPDDPLFWDPNNHQGACIHCNSEKGHSKKIGKFTLGGGV